MIKLTASAFLRFVFWLAVISLPAAADTEPPAPLPPLPNTDQLAWQESEYGLHLRFDLATFTGESRDPEKFNPAALDPRAWVQTARECGFRRVILTVNDADGFCLWPTKTTDHSVSQAAWRGGHGDVVKELADACREAGLAFGISITGYVRGQPVANTELIAKLRELLSNYGPISEARLDGAGGGSPGSTPSEPNATQTRDWSEIFAAIRAVQPHAIIVSNVGPDARWNGNNIGHAGEPQWSPFNLAALPGPLLTAKPQLGTLNFGDPNGSAWIPAECLILLRPNWAWRTEDDTKLLAPDRLFSAFCKSTGKNCVLLINVPLDPTGALPAPDVKWLRDLRASATQAFAQNLAAGARASASHTRGDAPAFAAKNVTDGRRDTYWATNDNVTGESWVEVDLGQPTSFNMVELREPITLGQRIATYRIEVATAEGWKPVQPNGKSIGRRKIERFGAVTAQKVRVVITSSRGCPLLSEFAVYLQR